MTAPGPPSDGVLCCFNASGESFAIASADGRLKTFDTSNGRLRFTVVAGAAVASASGGAARPAGGGAADQQTCLAWGHYAVEEEDGRKKRKKRGGGVQHELLFVGTASGTLKAYDTTLGELRWSVANCCEGGVSCIAFSPLGGGAVYCSGPTAVVVEVDASSGKINRRLKAGKHPLKCMALVPGSQQILVGSSSLALWDLNEKESRAKFMGHPTPVRTLAFEPSGTFAISAAEGERHLAVWSMPKHPKKKKKLLATHSLPMEHPAGMLDACSTSGSDDADGFSALGLSQSGEVYVWECKVGENDKMEGKLCGKIKVANDDGSSSDSDTILSARIKAGSEGPTVLLVHGNMVKPVFEEQRLQVGGKRPLQISIKPETAGLLLPTPAPHASREGTKDSRKRGREVVVLGPDDASEGLMLGNFQTGRLESLGNEESSGSKLTNASKQRKPLAEGHAAVVDEGVLDVSDQDGRGRENRDDVELTLGERVELLQCRDAGEGQAQGPEKRTRMTADSLSVLLTQAVRSEDKVLLEKCLIAKKGDALVRSTIRELLPSDAATLLWMLVGRLQAKPSRGTNLAMWIRETLIHHAAYLMQAPGVMPVLTTLYQCIEARLALFSPMLSLQGRLDLTLGQMKLKERSEEQRQQLATKPMVMYEESESEEEPEVEEVNIEAVDHQDADSEDGSEASLGDGSEESQDSGESEQGI